MLFNEKHLTTSKNCYYLSTNKKNQNAYTY